MLESTWNDKPGAWLYVVTEGASMIRELGRSKKGEIDNLERVSLAK